MHGVAPEDLFDSFLERQCMHFDQFIVVRIVE